ncbi:hypothetical protein SAMN05421664_2988 [Chryseobacterium soldanellicola]|uniref:DUF6268 domain-containing protein n=1 Tax=Chryseobacterium soldanellicola TaxID=311333 RepID=A0A1H1FDQ0_9FLAO|nr:DUF6268 family outer membrane beta-barrel protein [Chryseobacterium soldanellicola]SDQ98596.1 hypothetical protein SAMN05421664_2988 [Chryseobacterium soldanellicola]
MKMREWIKTTNFFLILAPLSTLVAQRNNPIDSTDLRKSAVIFVADKFAQARLIDLSYTYLPPFSFRNTSNEGIKSLDRANKFRQLNFNANVPILAGKKWLFNGTLGYRQTNLDFDLEKTEKDTFSLDRSFHYFSSSANVNYFSTLFNKKIIYTASVVLDGSDRRPERIKGFVMASMVLRSDDRTKMTVGAALGLDPGNPIFPFMPLFTYEHKLTRDFFLDFVFPQSVFVRTYITDNARLSLGSNLDGTQFYLYKLDGSKQTYEYRQLDINSGLVYEQGIGKYFVLTAKTGLKMIASGRILKKQDVFKDYIYEFKPDPTFYFNIGISFNPFSMLKSSHK